MRGKTARVSEIEMNELVLPNDTNLHGSLLGGRLMHWMDIAGGMVASRHSNRIVVTAGVDSLDFKHPVHLGDIVRIKARLTWVGRTSMEVKVVVFAENFETRQIRLTNQAHIVYVALDRSGHPAAVPRLLLESAAEKGEFLRGEKRRRNRMEKRRGVRTALK